MLADTFLLMRHNNGDPNSYKANINV